MSFFLTLLNFVGTGLKKNSFLRWIDNNFTEMDAIKPMSECFRERFNIRYKLQSKKKIVNITQQQQNRINKRKRIDRKHIVIWQYMKQLFPIRKTTIIKYHNLDSRHQRENGFLLFFKIRFHVSLCMNGNVYK